MPQKRSLPVRLLAFVWSAINGTRRLILNLVFFGLLAVILVGISQDQVPQVPEGAALVLNLEGKLVEQPRDIDPFKMLAGGADDEQEIVIGDLLKVIEAAAEDDRIAGIVLRPGGVQGGSAKLELVGRALARFRDSGKPVIAQSGWYSQGPYLLATFADEIQLNTAGTVAIQGMGMYRLFYKDLLDKIGVKTHLFRVGKYKSFAESYYLKEMSEPAKEANTALLEDIWGRYKATVNANRSLPEGLLDRNLAQLEAALEEVDGDFSDYALANGMVDSVLTSVQMRDQLFERFGAKADDDSKFNGIGWEDYLGQMLPEIQLPGRDQVAVVVAQGPILPGDQPAGTVGGYSLSKLLRQAREDDQVKAVVIRVDSPGGSVFASEQIRQEILALKAAGKTVVSSMGSVAASGGYWISANADRIYAQPNTITGSIGIIGIIQTFEETAKTIGVNMDGVGTTEMAGLNVFKPLPDAFKRIMQMNLNKGYADFINLVSSARGIPAEQVDEMAQGRVWSGTAAKELGLVDELGSLDDAVAGAAEIAGLGDYDRVLIEKELTPEQQIIREIMKNAAIEMPESGNSRLMSLLKQSVLGPLQQQLTLSDPQNAYMLCLECSEL
ncbi:signal peptide peptidase SppA [Ferrimonas sediminicola]|uniref:Signal peptide peptidase SppA n=1 Tax=Ferrimonas sediminicola TaxID=2569538 RepID=A0A4U1BJ31_9GAMM|nr:signal peptide peptidase SppA [Ferrimonas sediminicola]TKB50539.1 signal peptide peptidase SppA [Ferrimonas sediminicola]